MAPHSKIIGGLCATFLLASALPSLSAEIFTPANPGVLMQQNQLQIMENRLQRQQYQQNQQQMRQWDRQVVPSQPQQQKVPVMKPSCQLPGYGESGAVTGCR